MQHAAIVGWGKCLPPAVLTNKDLESFFETSDDWITQRTGIHERRVSHVLLGEMAYVAAERALAAAGVAGRDIELIVFGTCSFDEQVPNMASGLQRRIGSPAAAAMDVNTACTSFLYGLSTATAMIRNGIVKNALVIGAELISPYMDWTNRNVAVLFGDGAAAVVLEASDEEEGVLAEKLGLDHQKLFDISSKSSGQCWSLTSYCPVPGPVPTSPANRDYQAGFTAAMMLKDLKLSQDAAKATGTKTELGADAARIYSEYVASGEAFRDFSGIIRFIRD